MSALPNPPNPNQQNIAVPPSPLTTNNTETPFLFTAGLLPARPNDHFPFTFSVPGSDASTLEFTAGPLPAWRGRGAHSATDSQSSVASSWC